MVLYFDLTEKYLKMPYKVGFIVQLILFFTFIIHFIFIKLVLITNIRHHNIVSDTFCAIHVNFRIFIYWITSAWSKKRGYIIA